MTIRDLQKLQDFEDVIELAESFYKDQPTTFTINRDGMRRLLSQAMIPALSQWFCKVIEQDGKVVGFLFGGLGQMPYFDEVLAVEYAWYVKPEARGQAGESIKLLREFENWAEERGADYIALSHLGDPKIASVYERNGYVLKEHVYAKKLLG